MCTLSSNPVPTTIPTPNSAYDLSVYNSSETQENIHETQDNQDNQGNQIYSQIENEKTYKSHPPSWTPETHYGYGFCGQSCPCCRFYVEYLIHRSTFGVCDVCVHNSKIQQKIENENRKRNYETMKNSDESFRYTVRKSRTRHS